MQQETAIETFTRLNHVLQFTLGAEADWVNWQGVEELPARFHGRSRYEDVILQELWFVREINQRSLMAVSEPVISWDPVENILNLVFIDFYRGFCLGSYAHEMAKNKIGVSGCGAAWVGTSDRACSPEYLVSAAHRFIDELLGVAND